MKGQTEAFIEQTASRTDKPSIVMHNRHTKFTKEFVTALTREGHPDQCIASGLTESERSLGAFLPKHQQRLLLMPPVREKPEEVIRIDRDQVVVRSYAGGLVKWFERRAA